MSWITDDARKEMAAIDANRSHTRCRSSATKVLRCVDGKIAEEDRPAVIRGCSMFPYCSTTMAVDPSEVPGVAERLRKEGMSVDFDRAGRPIITSAKQQSDLAKAMGMKTGRDGYGHVDELGQFHNSGRRRSDEVKEGRAKVRRAIDTLEGMPESSSPNAVADVLNEYDIVPNEGNTG